MEFLCESLPFEESGRQISLQKRTGTAKLVYHFSEGSSPGKRILKVLTPAEWLINYLSQHHGIPKDVSGMVKEFSIVSYNAAVVRVDICRTYQLRCHGGGEDSDKGFSFILDTPFRLQRSAKEDSVKYLSKMKEPNCVTVISDNGVEIGIVPRVLSNKLNSLWAMIHNYKIEVLSIGSGNVSCLLLLYCGLEDINSLINMLNF